MHWRRLLALVIAIALWSAREAETQARRPWRLGYLGFDSQNPAVAAFVDGLRQLGYVDGKNIAIRYRWAGTDAARLPTLAAEIVAGGVDIIVAPGNLQTQAVAAVTKSIPIVAIGVINPVETGLVKTLAQPGGNITGLTWEIGTDPVAKKFETFKEMVPRVSRFAVVWNPTRPGLEPYRTPSLAAARTLGMRLEFFEYDASEAFEIALSAALKQRPDGMFVVSDSANYPRRQAICARALKSRVPTLADNEQWTRAGCLISYAANVSDLYRRAATYVDKILKGANPAQLPLEQPTTFNMVINRKSASALGLTIPPLLLLRADQVID
jgi:putative ABC transport system substrate-binding protein